MKYILTILILISLHLQLMGQDTSAQILELIEPNCQYLSGNTITLTMSSGSNGANETTQYILTSQSGQILQLNTTPTFNGLSTGAYIAYAISYETSQGINQLNVGGFIQHINSNGCYDFSSPYSFTVCPPPNTCDKFVGNNITLNATGGNTVNGTTRYVLTDSSGKILLIQNTTTFSPLSQKGNYFAYALSYSNTTNITGLAQGNFLNAIIFSDTCYDWSTPYIFQVCDITLELCNNGIDDDGDGLTDCADPDCGQPSISQVSAFDPTIASCPNLDNGSIAINATGAANLEYSIDGTTFQSTNIFNNLIAGSYTITVRNSQTGCQITSTATVTAPTCPQNPIPVLPTSPTACNYTNVTSVTLNVAGGSNTTGETTEYVLTDMSGNILQVSNSPTFSGLSIGDYAVYAISYETAIGVNNLSQGNNIQSVTSVGCLDFSSPFSFRICANEICNNGIDDDGDGLTDCADPDCGQPSISQVSAFDPTIASCPNLDNGSIAIDATGAANLEYSIDGTTFQSTNIFNNLIAGSYTITVRNSQTGCQITSTATVTAPTCPQNPIPVLPTSPTACNYTNVTSVTLNVAGGSNTTGETTEYVLTDLSGNILQVSNSPTFSGLSIGDYAVYAISYETAIGVNNLSQGNNIQSITSNGCLDFSQPYSFQICSSQISIFFQKSLDKDTVRMEETVFYTFTIINNTGAILNNVAFSDVLNNNGLFFSDPVQITGGLQVVGNTLNTNAANLTLNNIPIGNSSFQLAVDIPAGLVQWSSYCNQATLGNLSASNPSLPDTILSDDPSTSIPSDGTCTILKIYENCCNCIDDDGDGLADANDPDCQ